ncbi:hypothetical protein [Parasphingorhabdus pacifica]
MTDADLEPLRYAERGASWWPVGWGPAFALVGLVVELSTPGPLHVALWLLLGGVLAAASAVWVHGRRRLCSVRLTASTLALGREEVELARIEAVTDVGAPVGARVLGGGWTVPKGTGEVPVRLTDQSVVLAWALDPEALTEELRELVEK